MTQIIASLVRAPSSSGRFDVDGKEEHKKKKSLLVQAIIQEYKNFRNKSEIKE
jgi:hypothetical protein